MSTFPFASECPRGRFELPFKLSMLGKMYASTFKNERVNQLFDNKKFRKVIIKK